MSSDPASAGLLVYRRAQGDELANSAEVLPRQPLRQWVLSVPFRLRFLFATEPAAVTAVVGIVCIVEPNICKIEGAGVGAT